jgi:hypothetical protein
MALMVMVLMPVVVPEERAPQEQPERQVLEEMVEMEQRAQFPVLPCIMPVVVVVEQELVMETPAQVAWVEQEREEKAEMREQQEVPTQEAEAEAEDIMGIWLVVMAGPEL